MAALAADEAASFGGDDLSMLLTVLDGLEESSDGCLDKPPPPLAEEPKMDPEPGLIGDDLADS